MNLTIECFVDGSRKKDGKGGWSYLYYYNGVTYFVGSFDNETTNNKMELRGPIELLERLSRHSWIVEQPIKIVSDSMYFVNGFNIWMHTWHNKDWNRGTKNKHKEVSNLDMWKHLFSFRILYNIQAKWERGHNGHPENELCDKIANYCCIHKVNISGAIPKSITPSILGAHELSSFVSVEEDPFKISGY